MTPGSNPFEQSMQTVQKINKDGSPDLSNFSVERFEVSPDEFGLAKVPDWAAKRLESHGYKVVDKDAAIAAEKERRAKSKQQPEKAKA